MKTIQIIGGGLTGLSLGIALRKLGVPVVLHEATHYPRHKVCGEFINGVKQSTLEFLGIDKSFESAHRHSQVNWFHRNKPFYQFDLSVPALAISRFRLDKDLADTFSKAGGTLHTGSRKNQADQDGTVIASGRKLEKESKWIGLKSHFTNLNLISDLEMHIGKSGYLGLCRVEGGHVNACGLFLKTTFSNHSKGVQILFDYLTHNGLLDLRERLEGAIPVSESFKGVTAFSLGERKHHTTKMVIGDQHSIIPPFTGNGMSMAFESAELACEPLLRYSNGEISWEEASISTKRRIAKKFRARMLLSGFLHPLFFSPIGQQLLYRMGSSHLIPIQTISRLLR